MNPRLLRILLFSAISLSVLLAVWIVDRSEQAHYQERVRSIVLRRTSGVRAQLEGALNRRLFFNRGLVAHVATNPNITQSEFEVLAEILVAQQAGIRSLQLAKNSVVSHIHPLKGNEVAMGRDLLKSPARRPAVERSIETERLVVGGPTELLQGGIALIGYTPIFLKPAKPSDAATYWGLAMTVIDLEPLLREAGVIEGTHRLRLAIRGKDGVGATGDVFFGEGNLFESNPVLADISFPNGSWQMAAAPMSGWDSLAPGTWKLRFGGCFLVLMIAVLAWVLAREPERLQQAVNRATVALAESETRLRTLAKLSPVGLFHADTEGRCLYVSEHWCEVSGFSAEEAKGDGWVRSVHPEDRERIVNGWAEAVRTGQSFEAEFRLQHPGGKTIWVFGQSVAEMDESGKVTGHVGAATNITERKDAEAEASRHQAELAHVLRLSTMGEMASGIAHELNQPLTAIVNYSRGSIIRLGQRGADSDSALIEVLEHISNLAVRAGDIIRRLRSFVRKEEPKRVLVQLNGVVREAMHFFEEEARRAEIALQLELSREDIWVLADSVQIEQVVLNLVRNGLEALSGNGHESGLLSIKTAALDQHLVQVAVRDNGKGIPEAALPHIFDPFFTTRPGGMGVGLSISRSIVEAHGGDIHVVNNSDGGCTFQFTLPVRNGANADDA
ncbi:MAG: ATP-binding protein [Acidobacteria bacterium]|nr:ATP-binding protein [Acidobacteriota bacterium]MCI0719356.1 ATP-binding protein [Acidobacteriota bacterium]